MKLRLRVSVQSFRIRYHSMNYTFNIFFTCLSGANDEVSIKHSPTLILRSCEN